MNQQRPLRQIRERDEDSAADEESGQPTDDQHRMNISDREMKEYRNAFALFDKDGDGTITAKELGTVMRSLGQNPTEAELQDIIMEVDADGSGEIDFEEFMSMIQIHMETQTPEEEMKETFAVFDVNDNGFITAKELKQVLNRLGERVSDDDVKSMIAAADKDRDGMVSYREFMEMMNAESD